MSRSSALFCGKTKKNKKTRLGRVGKARHLNVSFTDRQWPQRGMRSVLKQDGYLAETGSVTCIASCNRFRMNLHYSSRAPKTWYAPSRNIVVSSRHCMGHAATPLSDFVALVNMPGFIQAVETDIPLRGAVLQLLTEKQEILLELGPGDGRSTPPRPGGGIKIRLRLHAPKPGRSSTDVQLQGWYRSLKEVRPF